MLWRHEQFSRSGSREKIVDSREVAWQENMVKKKEWKVPHCRAIGRTIRESSEIYGREVVFRYGWSQWRKIAWLIIKE